MVPKRLGTAVLEDTLYTHVVVYDMTSRGLCLTHVCPYVLLLKSRPDLMTFFVMKNTANDVLSLV